MKQLARTVATNSSGRTGDSVPSADTAFDLDDTSRGLERDQVMIVAGIAAIGYYAGSLLGLTLQTSPVAISSLWPPNAFLLGLLLLSARRHWWIFIAAALPAHLLAHGAVGVPVTIMIIQFASNVAQALLGALVFQTLAGKEARFNSLKSTAWFIATAALAIPAIVAFLAGAVFEAVGWRENVWESWRIRFQSNALAVMTITPLMVKLWQGRGSFMPALSFPRAIEAAGIAAGLVVTSHWVAIAPASPPEQALPILYLPVPLLLLASVRFGVLGACLSVLTLAIIKVWGAFYTSSSLLGPEPVEGTLAFGLFLLVTAIPLLLLGTLLEERDKAQRTAHRIDADLQKLIESTAAIPWQADVATASVTYIGPQAVELFGYSQQDWQRRGFWHSRLHPSDREMVWSVYEKASQSTQSFEFECRMTGSDGQLHWLHHTVRCEHRDGKPFRLRGFMIDITARRLAETEEKRRRAEMAHLNRVATMGEFAASITHEIFQPLGSILNSAGAAELFLHTDPPALDRVEEMLVDIRKGDKRAVEIIRRMRNLLQKHEIVLAPLDMNELVDDTIDLLRAEAEARNVRLHFEPERGLPPVAGDPIHLQQVLTNLAINAFDAMAVRPEGKRYLRVRTASDADGCGIIAVSDTGTGIPDHLLPTLFDTHVTTKSKGLGMGLSISRTIMEAHHGRILVENNTDGGATFELRFPASGGSSS